MNNFYSCKCCDFILLPIYNIGAALSCKCRKFTYNSYFDFIVIAKDFSNYILIDFKDNKSTIVFSYRENYKRITFELLSPEQVSNFNFESMINYI